MPQSVYLSIDFTIFLFLDSAGGQGTGEIVDRYVRMLVNDYTLICIHQRPRSPTTNMLDIEVWMALQSVVEKLHHDQRQELNALCSTIEKAREELDMVKLTNVYERWKMVLDLILKDNGSSKFIQANRVRLFQRPSQEAEELDNTSWDKVVGAEDMTRENIDNANLGLN